MTEATVLLAAFHFGLAAMSVALAVVVLRAAPRQSVNRDLATYFAVAAVNGAATVGEILFQSRPVVAYHFFLAVAGTNLSFVCAYLAFVGTAVASPLARPLRARAVRVALLGVGVVALPAVFVAHQWLAPTPVTLPYFGASWRTRLDVPTGTLYIVAFTFALVAAISALIRTRRGTPSRSRAATYLLGFGLLDGILVASNAIFVASRVWGFDPNRPAYVGLVIGMFVAAFVFLAVAVLRFQLVEFDLKVKWTLRRGTVVAAFLAAFFVAFAIAEQWLQQYGVVAGGIAVGLLLFALRPLERAADRIAETALPGVRTSEDYLTVRRRDVYRAAVESALADGVITDKERDVLATLADQLKIGAKEALDIERDAAGARGSKA